MLLLLQQYREPRARVELALFVFLSGPSQIASPFIFVAGRCSGLVWVGLEWDVVFLFEWVARTWRASGGWRPRVGFPRDIPGELARPLFEFQSRVRR